MKVLVVHNYYQQPGGEGWAFADECELLANHGHQVMRYTLHNNRIKRMTTAAVAKASLWNSTARREIRDLVRYHDADVVHFHNTFPLISPTAYYGAKDRGVAVVQTLHNYRLMCPAGAFFRDGAVCQECLGRRVAWPGIKHRCYRGSRTQTAAAAAVMATHHTLGTWRTAVDLFITPTDFTRLKYVQGGLPPDRVVVKPHFVRGEPKAGRGEGGYALFVGRLSDEKGISVLLDGWRQRKKGYPLKVVGDGPLAPAVQAAAGEIPGVEWLGKRGPDEVGALMQDASMLIVPSQCFETFGRVVIEAFARGTPVVAAEIGALAELVVPGHTGQLFQPGNGKDLIDNVERLLSDPSALCNYRRAARAVYETKYTASANHEMLQRIYLRAIRGVSADDAKTSA